MRIISVGVLKDNYAYLLVDEDTGATAVVDPGEAEPVIQRLQAENRDRSASAGPHELKLVAILNTHHHHDHTGGNEALLQAFPALQVVGFAADRARIPGLSQGVRVGDEVRVGALCGRVLEIPCHTSGHIAFHFGNALFTGDTLFVAGCGRFFEGTAADMYRALYEVIGRLPDDTLIYCGHEYTVRNLEFAASIEPSNPAVQEKLRIAKALRANNQPTVPSRLGDERHYNPFMRAGQPEVQAHFAAHDAVATLAAMRAAKDAF